MDIPEKELRDVQKFTRAKTKREAVVAAVVEYNRRRRAAKLLEHFGTFESLMTNDELESLEAQEGGGR